MQDLRKAKSLIIATRSLGEYGSMCVSLFGKFAHVIISAEKD